MASDHNFVYVTSKANEELYLKVDTAANSTGIGFLKFGWTDNIKNKVEGGLLDAQHQFLFSYKPSVDSLFIQVKEARYKMRNNLKNIGRMSQILERMVLHMQI